MFQMKRAIVAAVSLLSYALPFAQTTSRGAEAPLPRASAVEQYDVGGGPVSFEFKYKEGDSYRILSTVNEDVFVNRRLNHHATIINRIAYRVTAVSGDGTGSLEGTFMTSEDSTGSLSGAKFVWSNEAESRFERSRLGVFTISDDYVMPTVRDLPVFPGRPVSPGESWTGTGYEAHDFRDQFDLAAPYKVPFTATYTYLGTVSKEQADSKTSAGAKLHVINAKYTLYTETPAPSRSARWSDYPVLMMGFSDELIYWDAEKGAIDHYTENFRIIMQTAYGNVMEFRGVSQAEITEFSRVATAENIEDIQQQVEELGLQNVTVTKSDKGLTLSIENIQFRSESALLLASEKQKINKLAKILEAYPNDILVTGHTADAPGGSDPQVLSEQRAQAVADYLIQLGVRDQFHIFTQGLGNSQPIAPNSTPQGRAKNRRVEITIMDN